VVFPLVFGFLAGVAPEGVAVTPDITYYLDFAIKMFFAFGLAFEVPIATILVVWSGMTTAEALAAKRPYVIVAAFVFGMLLTPPDVISQTLLAVPMWLLFELGLIFSRYYTKPKQAEEENSIGGEAVAAAATGATTNSRVEPSFGEETTGSDTVTEDDTPADDYGDNWDEEDANDSGHGEYEPLSEEELDAELDQIEAEEEAEAQDPAEEAQSDDKTGPRKND
jgi:sec-independent protein translocase protein TatC